MEVRIYYEDTDAGGVVYHANYLRYMERARTEFLRERGMSVQEMHDRGIIFPVVAMDISYRAPARLDTSQTERISLHPPLAFGSHVHRRCRLGRVGPSLHRSRRERRLAPDRGQ